MQRGVLTRLILQTVNRKHIQPACGRVSVILSHLRYSSNQLRTMAYSTVERGQPNTLDYRVFFKDPNGRFISPFHDIPLFADESRQVLNMVVEIPRWSNAKMEINKDEKLNPIKQDVKKGNLRYVKNIFPHHGYIWNYGALPQTWEDPNPQCKFEETGTNGDNDPLDVCEIGEKIHGRGAVVQVKVLGTMLLVDEGETDWKVIAIDVTDPLANKLNDINDVEREMPGFLRATYEWFRYYKVPDDKPENTVHWNGTCKDKAYAMNVIKETNERWKALMADPSIGGGIACFNTSVQGSPDTVSPEKANSIMQEGGHRSQNVLRRAFSSTMALFLLPFRHFRAGRAIEYTRSKEAGPAAPIDQSVNKWYYVIPQQ